MSLLERLIGRTGREAEYVANPPKPKRSLAWDGRSVVGLKRQYVPGTEGTSYATHTPYYRKLLARRRAANRRARLSRRRNRSAR